MSIFIKAGLWSQKAKGFLGEFNLTKYIKDLIAETPVEGGITSVNTLTGPAVSLTTENIPVVADKNYVTDAEKALINTQVISETDYLDVINGYSVSGQDYTFLDGWTWVINGITGYTNPTDVTINFPLTAPTYSRIDVVVTTNYNTFIRIPGTPSLTTPASPAIPADSVYVLFVTVDDVSVTTVPGPIGGKAQVSNQPYNAITWDNKTNIAPSQNAVRDKIESLTTNFIPLTGTGVSNPVSGNIEVLETAKGIWSKGGSYPDDYSGIFLGEGSSGLYFRNLFDNNEVSIRTYDSGVVISDNRLTAIGLTGLQDFSPNITDLDYTQKIYVDALLPQVANDFANDAAAAIGGIAVGRLYHTAGVVKIRLS